MLFVLAALFALAGLVLWILDARLKARAQAVPALDQDVSSAAQSVEDDFEDSPIFQQLDSKHPHRSARPPILRPEDFQEPEESVVSESVAPEPVVQPALDPEVEEELAELPEPGDTEVVAAPLEEPVEEADLEIKAEPTLAPEQAATPKPEGHLGHVARGLLAKRKPRKAWAADRGYSYQKTDPFLHDEWHRGAAAQGATAREVVSGRAFGHEMVLADLDAVTVVAMRRQAHSQVVLDFRRGDVTGQDSDDLFKVREVGDFCLYADDQGVGHRFVDARVKGALAGLPESVSAVWCEGDWVLAQTPKNNQSEQWDDILAPLAILAETTRVLPPSGAVPVVDFSDSDPSRPLPVAPQAQDAAEEEDLPQLPTVVREEPEVTLPSRLRAETRGEVQDHEIGEDEVDAIGQSLDPGDTAHGTRIVRQPGHSSIFEDGIE